MKRSNEEIRDEKPHYEREVSSERPYVEDGSVRGDNDPKTALDPRKEEHAR